MTILTSTTALLLVVGLLILAANLVFSAFRVATGHIRAGALNVILVIGACVLITVGLVRVAFPVLAGEARPAFAAPGGASGNGGGTGGNGGNAGASGNPGNSGNPSGTRGQNQGGNAAPSDQTGVDAGGQNGGQASGQTGGQDSAQPSALPPVVQTAVASGSLPAPMLTQIAEGTIPARMQTAIAGGGSFGGGQGNGQRGQGQGGQGGQNGQSGQSGQPGQDGQNSQSSNPAPGATDRPISNSAVGNNTGGSSGGDQTGGQGGQPGQGGQSGQGGNGQRQRGQGQGGQGGQGGQSGQGSQSSGSAQVAPVAGQSQGAAAFAATAQANQTLVLMLMIGAAIVLVIGLILFFVERRRTGFAPSSSPGLLYTGAGIFVLVAAFLLPSLPGQFFPGAARAGASSFGGAGGAGGGRAVAAAATNGPIPTRVILQTPVPTGTLEPSVTPTALPSLTPTMNVSPTPLFTAVAYVNTNPTAQPTNCSVVAQQPLFLRSDPSTKNQAIGKIFAGTLLYVTGSTSDKKWWQVVDASGVTPVEGWVSGDYVKPSKECLASNIPMLGPTPTATLTPKPSNTPAVQSNGDRASMGAGGSASAVASCTLITTTAISLRPDPSRSKVPVAMIPQGTALVATLKSNDNTWWKVVYGEGSNAKEGWVGNGGVFTASACISLVSATLTPVP